MRKTKRRRKEVEVENEMKKKEEERKREGGSFFDFPQPLFPPENTITHVSEDTHMHIWYTIVGIYT